MSTRTGVMGAAIIMATGLAACAVPNPAMTSQPQSPSASVPTPSVTPSVTPSTTPTTTTAPTPSGTAVKATGRLGLFFDVTKALVGTCAQVEGVPTLTLSDKKNDFYGTVDVTVLLASDGGAVSSLTADFGEDSELITRRMVYTDKPRAEGTSARLGVSGREYKITGKATMFEDQSTAGSLVPYSITAKCAADWLE